MTSHQSASSTVSDRAQLIIMLRDVYDITSVMDDAFELRPRRPGSDRTVIVRASPFAVARRVESLRVSALQALGDVGDDPSGRTAGIGLLAVHIEETIEADGGVIQVDVSPGGVSRS